MKRLLFHGLAVAIAVVEYGRITIQRHRHRA